ncbi:hypothetical protein [Pseudomonas sp.]|uniref:hypothetical protein n=1 Tax=Pseudomonas sp. TaxID=306 RepID=UPI0028B1D299|nr:hypothetical protein [Pseudomonas sp.]
MSFYRFTPEKSMLARLYWQPTEMNAGQEDASQLRRIGAVRNGDTPWAAEGWLHAGHDDFTNHAVADYVLSRRKFATQFWLGCYATNGEPDYEIRAAGVDDLHHHWTYANWRLDVSRNGYLGLYETSEPVGHDALADGSMLWRLEGLPDDALRTGIWYYGIKLVSLHGKSVKRVYEGGFPYLNEDHGSEGFIALNVIRTGAAKP